MEKFRHSQLVDSIRLSLSALRKTGIHLMARKHLSVQQSGFTIMVVDDQEEIRLAIQYLLEREGVVSPIC